MFRVFPLRSRPIQREGKEQRFPRHLKPHHLSHGDSFTSYLPSVHHSIHSSTHSSTIPFIHSFSHSTFYFNHSIQLPISFSIHIPIHLPHRLSSSQSTYLTIHPSFIHSYFFPSIHHQNRKVWNHDHIFYCGDFNYRIDMKKDEVKELVNLRDWSKLQSADQLTVQRLAGNVRLSYK